MSQLYSCRALGRHLRASGWRSDQSPPGSALPVVPLAPSHVPLCPHTLRWAREEQPPPAASRLELSMGMCGTGPSILPALPYPPNSVIVKPEPQNLLTSLFQKCFIDPAGLLRAGIHPPPARPWAQHECYLWYPLQQTPIFSRAFLAGLRAPCFLHGERPAGWQPGQGTALWGPALVALPSLQAQHPLLITFPGVTAPDLTF